MQPNDPDELEAQGAALVIDQATFEREYNPVEAYGADEDDKYFISELS